MKLPWPFSTDTTAGPLTLNVPSEEGRFLGEQFARFYVTAKCEAGAEDERCHDCAFRLGSLPNGCTATLGDVMKCLVEQTPFYCHHGIEDGEPKRLCAGYAMLAENDAAKRLATGDAWKEGGG